MHLADSMRSPVARFLLVLGALFLFFASLKRFTTAGPDPSSQASQGSAAASGDAVYLRVDSPEEPMNVLSSAVSSPKQEAIDYLRELELLAETDKPAALAMAQSPDGSFPRAGVYAEAREAMSITLLVDLGRMPEARDEVRRFIRLHPQSRYRPLVQGVTGIHPRPTKSDYQ